MIDFSDIPKYRKKEWVYDEQQMSLIHSDLNICFYLKSILYISELVSLIIQYKSLLSTEDYNGLLRILNTVCENIIGQNLKHILNSPLNTRLYWGDEFSAFQQNEDVELCKNH